jgi:hypothetical protein
MPKYYRVNVLLLIEIPDDRIHNRFPEDCLSELLSNNSSTMADSNAPLLTWELTHPYDDAIQEVLVEPGVVVDYDIDIAGLHKNPWPTER